MSYCEGIISCPAAQDQLVGNFGVIDPAMREQSVLTELLLRPEFRGFQQKMVPGGNNRKRMVELIYQKQLLESAVSDTAVQACDGGDEPGECSHFYELDENDGVSIKWSITPASLIDSCNNDAFFFGRELQRMMDGLKARMETRNILKAIDLVGAFAGGATSVTLETETAAGVPNRKAIQEIRYQMNRMDYNGTVYLFAGGKEYQFFWSDVAAACCNSVLGVDLGAVARQNQNIVPFISNKFADVWNEDRVLSLIPGAIQLVTYNKFASPETQMNDDSYKQGRLMDPTTGLDFDYVAKFDCGIWHFQLMLAFDLFGAPPDMFPAGTLKDGVTFVNQWLITNP